MPSCSLLWHSPQQSTHIKASNINTTGAYEFIKKKGYIPYDTCQPYLACSSESTDGFCKFVDSSCKPMNTCRTCTHGSGTLNHDSSGTTASGGGKCSAIDVFPNATVGEYGSYGMFETDRVHKIMAELYARGPVAAGTFLFDFGLGSAGVLFLRSTT